MPKSDSSYAGGDVPREIIEIFRELLHHILVSSIPAWIDLQLTLPQLRTLFAVAHNKTSSVMRIAGYCGIGKPTASHLVDKLVQAGLVDRREDPEDRRRAVIRLSAAGERLIEGLLGWEKLIGGSLSKIPQEDLPSFRDVLKELVIALPGQTINDKKPPEEG